MKSLADKPPVRAKDTTKSNNGAAQSSVPAQDEKRRKGWVRFIFIGLFVVTVLTVCGLITVVMFSGDSDSRSKDRNIALINVDGVITGASSYDFFGEEIDSMAEQTISHIQKAADDDSIEVILLRIESPGGEAIASDDIYRAVIEAREEKPVVAYSSTMAASGGYYIGAGADHFMTNASGITGSIGVIMQVSSLEGLYEKLGIETATFKSGELKDSEGLFDDDPNGAQEKMFESIVDHYYQEFLDAIVAGRGMDKNVLIELADGRIYTGEQALTYGLVDSNGHEEDAIAKAKELAGNMDLGIKEYGYDSPGVGLFSSLSENSPLGLLLNRTLSVEAEPGVKVYYLPEL